MNHSDNSGNGQQILKQQLAYLVEQGLSTAAAIQKINDSRFAIDQQWHLTETALSLGTMDDVKGRFRGLAPVLNQYHEELLNQPQALLAKSRVQQQQQLISAGWKMFRSSFLGSLLYLCVLTALVLFFRLVVGPQFELIYAEYSGLPWITQVAFGPTGWLVLVFLWSLGLLYVGLVVVISRCTEYFRFWPKWFRYVPIFRRFRETINRMMLLATADFIVRAGIQPFPEATLWSTWFGTLDGPQEDHVRSCHQLAAFSLELGSFKTTIAEEQRTLENAFIDLATHSLKAVTLLFGLILGLVIGFFVLAMYAPIFQLGSVI